ncbi:sulfate reduction electron transfer complex DsrMKJOP subunit DsrJ [Desulfonatronovibrio hydrogenovorans]|uniref:sulfate reduction electron transfer complex DsrMKJOP subunit DsrJ n=1 Tax=Desulfonatronovibrio hydrogenovorans TaxID=53245 RepID=UPI0004909EB6|nr:sulfate reduction electron transfer complex DsrMKJOP subunit DsrJ [Desulfonatronovibrio hydrogenovorans]
MYHANKIIPGLVIFGLLMTFPFWFNIGSAAYSTPELVLPEDHEFCVESVEYMRAEHMSMLNEWRDAYVRDGYGEYQSMLTGQMYPMSLTKTCMNCHNNKEEFCDRCHASVSVDPYCWDCHIEPQGVE